MLQLDVRSRAGVLRAPVRAAEHGFDARVLPDEYPARRWLHCGAA